MFTTSTTIMHDQPFNADSIPDKWLGIIVHYVTGFDNNTEDFQRPYIRPVLRPVYPLIIFLYASVILFGIVSNVAMLVVIVRQRLYKDVTLVLVANLAVADLVKCIFVLPITLANLLIQNWMFGRFMCFFLPMLQDIPIHATTLTFLTIAIDRYRFIMYPTKLRFPACICVIGIWLLAVGVVFPHLMYTKYFDLAELFGPQFAGNGLCIVNIEDDIEEYIRGMFIALYVLPLAVVAFLHVRASGEIKAKQEMQTTAVTGEMSFTSDDRSRPASVTDTYEYSRSPWLSAASSNTTVVPISGQETSFAEAGDVPSRHSRGPRQTSFDSRRFGLPILSEVVDDFDAVKEKRNQKYLITMVMFFAVYMFPLNILRLVKHILYETYDNTHHFDITYVMLVLIAFIPTCTTPSLFASWRMNRPVSDRLMGYFRLNNRRNTSLASHAPPTDPPTARGSFACEAPKLTSDVMVLNGISASQGRH